MRAAVRRDQCRYPSLETQALPGKGTKPRTQSQKAFELWTSGMEQIGYLRAKLGVSVEQVEMVSRANWVRTDSHSECLKRSHAAESCWMETIPPFLEPHSTLHLSGHCPHYLSLCFLEDVSIFLPYQNINSLKASPGLTQLCTTCPTHTQCLASVLHMVSIIKICLSD